MRLTVNGLTLNVIERGPRHPFAPTLVLLHYFGGSAQEWLPVMDSLAERFHCVAPDLRGFGDSDAPATGYTVSDYADDVLALTDALECSHYVLVGHSMSGKFALAAAARQPEGLARMVLLAPSPPTPEPMANEDRQRLLHGYGQRTQAEETVRQITARPLPAPLFAQAVDDNLRTSRPAWDAWLQDGSREDLSALMAQVTVSTLIVAGGSDPVLPAPLLQHEVATRLSRAQLTILADVGHLSPIETPASVAELIAGEIFAAERYVS